MRRVASGLRFPFAVAVDARGNVFITDSEADRAVRVDPAGATTTVAGGGSGAGLGDNGPATQATLLSPRGVIVDSAGVVYIADSGNDRVRRVSNGTITTFAGGGNSLADGIAPTSARLASPRGLALDGAGNLYITEVQGNRVRRVSTAGVIATIAGTGEAGLAGDGTRGRRTVECSHRSCRRYGGQCVDRRQRQSPDSRRAGDASARDHERPGAFVYRAEPRDSNSAPHSWRFQPRRRAAVCGRDASGVVERNSSSGIVPPGAIEVVADPSSLPPGSYTGQVSVRTPNGSPTQTDIPVTFEVQPAREPRETVSPRELFFAFLPQTPARSQRLTVANQGGGRLDFSVTSQTDAGGNG